MLIDEPKANQLGLSAVKAPALLQHVILWVESAQSLFCIRRTSHCKHSSTERCYENPPLAHTELLLGPWSRACPMPKNILETCCLCWLEA